MPPVPTNLHGPTLGVASVARDLSNAQAFLFTLRTQLLIISFSKHLATSANQTASLKSITEDDTDREELHLTDFREFLSDRKRVKTPSGP